MDETTAQIVRELAEKLGTTTDHLFMVLVKQAPISATMKLVLCIALACAAIWWVRLVMDKTTVHDSERYPEWHGEGTFAAWLGAIVAVIVALTFIGSTSESIVAGFFNPEYWALKQILK